MNWCTLHILYYWAIPPVFAIFILLIEMFKPIGLFLKLYSIGLVVVLLFHYVRLLHKYEPDILTFTANLEQNKPTYYVATAYLGISLIAYLWIKFKKK